MALLENCINKVRPWGRGYQSLFGSASLVAQGLQGEVMFTAPTHHRSIHEILAKQEKK